MSWLKSLWQNWFGRPRAERELDDELRFHLDALIAENVRRGMPPEEARRQAQLELGRVEQVKEEVREGRVGFFLETLWQDVRYGARMLRRNPGFTLVAVLTLALGIGGNSAIFSAVNGVLLRPLPYPEADRLLAVWADHERRGGPRREWTNPADFYDWRSQNAVFQEMYAFTGWAPTLTGDGEPELLRGAVVTHGVFATLGISPALGAGFGAAEDTPNGPRVVVLTDGLWRRRFGGDPGVIGRTVRLSDGRTYTISGVMPARFRLPFFPGLEIFTAAQWPADRRGGAFIRVVGRLKPGVKMGQAQSEMSAIGARLAQQYADTNKSVGVYLMNLQDDLAGPARKALLVLLGAVGFVLLIACANVANLLLARATARQKEIAIRIALGAGRARLVRQLLAESALLSLTSGILGLALAWWAAGWLSGNAPDGFGGTFDLALDRLVVGFTLLLALVTGVVFGLTPALHAARTVPQESLKEGGRGSTGSGHRLRSAFVVAELALSLVLLIGAGLLLKSFYSLLRVHPGFNPENLLVAQIGLSPAKYPEAAQSAQFYAQLLENLRRLPGVRDVAAVSNLPLGGTNTDTSFLIEGRPAPPPDQVPVGWFTPVTSDYFRTMGIPLVRGRLLDERDHPQAPLAIVINESMAKKYWPGEDPTRYRIGTGRRSPQGPTWWQVVGVVANVRQFSLETDEPPAFYFSHAQRPARAMNIVIRAAGDPLALAAPLRGTVWAMDRDLAITRITTMESLIGSSLAPRRFTMALLAGFAALALVLAGIGIYGVMAYAVTQRTREIGIRMALGAEQSAILRLVIGQGMLLALFGAMVGLPAALTLTRLMQSLLFDVSATDPLTYAAVGLLLLGIALLACWIPARRATRVDPMVALRHE